METTAGETLHGGGALVDLNFEVIGLAGQTSTLTFVLTQTSLYRCDDPLNPLQLDLDSTGVFSVANGYGIGDVDGDGVVDAEDADLVLETSVGAIEATETLRDAGDVNADGWINAADATLIMRMTAGLPLAPDGGGLQQALTGAQGDSVTLDAPEDVWVPQGGSVWVPIGIDDAAAVAGADLILLYDPYVVEAVDARRTGLSDHLDLAFHEPTPGQVHLALRPKARHEGGLAGGAGALVELYLEDNTTEQWVKTTPLNLLVAHFNDQYGRDFSRSALQIEVDLVDGSLMVEDSTPPEILTVNPPDATSKVPLDEEIYVGFSDVMSTESLDVQIVPGVTFTESWNETATAVTLEHADFDEATTYAVTVSADDAAGNPVTSVATWAFTTTVTDAQPPSVTDALPVAGATAVAPATSVVVRFSEEIFPGSLHMDLTPDPLGQYGHRTGWVFSWGAGNTVVTATHPSWFTGTRYTVTVAAEDRAGNPLSQPFSWSFTTGETGPQVYLPVVVRNYGQ
jgi:hypothetical protein